MPLKDPIHIESINNTVEWELIHRLRQRSYHSVTSRLGGVRPAGGSKITRQLYIDIHFLNVEILRTFTILRLDCSLPNWRRTKRTKMGKGLYQTQTTAHPHSRLDILLSLHQNHGLIYESYVFFSRDGLTAISSRLSRQTTTSLEATHG